ncbi:MAG: hypothetical protein K0A94_09235 [Desulfuromonadales bacterium]|nr:hypothetical protein [Desulfuromonadales bacterium]
MAPLSAAERQRRYRYNRPTAGENGERRLNTWISTAAALALRRIAAHEGISQRATLERLILAADDAKLTALRSNEAAWQQYLDRGTTRTTRRNH